MTPAVVDVGPSAWAVAWLFVMLVLVAGSGALIGYGLGKEHGQLDMEVQDDGEAVSSGV